MVNENLYFDNLNVELENKRLKKEKDKYEHLQTIHGKCETAYTHFKMWCRCNGYDPYVNTYTLLKEYLYGKDTNWKNEDRLMFDRNTNGFQKNKKILFDIIKKDLGEEK